MTDLVFQKGDWRLEKYDGLTDTGDQWYTIYHTPCQENGSLGDTEADSGIDNECKVPIEPEIYMIWKLLTMGTA